MPSDEFHALLLPKPASGQRAQASCLRDSIRLRSTAPQGVRQNEPVTPTRRRWALIALVAVTGVLLATAAVSWYAHSALVDEREFGARAVSALDDSDVRVVLADRVVGGLSGSAVPDALSVRPLLVRVLAPIADTRAFRRLFTRTVRARHAALINGERTFAFEVPVGDGLLFESLERFAPRLARRIPPGLSVPILRLDPREFERTAARWLVDFSSLRWPLLLLALLAAAGSALLSGGARSALVSLGVAVAGAGLLVAAAVFGLGEYVVAHASSAADLGDDRERAAIRAVWSAMFADLRTAALVAVLGGAVVAALASRGLPDPAAGRRWLSRLARSPAPAARLARAAALVAVGVALVLEPGFAGRLLLVAGGLLVVLVGLGQLSPGERTARETPQPGGASPLLIAGAVVAAIATTVLIVALVLPGPRAVTLQVAGSAVGCNGSRALCDRRLDQVVFPATHNSYAAADEPGWLFANQRRGIARQLRDGIRAFLIDIHYGAPDPASGRIRTDFEAEGTSRNKVAQELSPEALRTADRLVGRVGVGRPTGERRPYLCHTLCELGAEPLEEQLELFASFLEAKRRDVVILFVEPYVPVEEIERALERTGLLDQAAEIRPGEPLPTLRELARAGTRLVVLTEKDGGARLWYLPGFELAQDTPLGARTGAELSCRRYRGEPDSPLFLLNHWIDTFPPSPSRNERIGGSFLEQRLSRCEALRRQLPNLVAVDFYERSDVVDSSAELNAARR